MNIAESKTKKTIAISMIVFVIGGSLVAVSTLTTWLKDDDAQQTSQTIVQAPIVSTDKVLGEQTQTSNNGGYDVTASSIVNQAGIITVNIVVKNTSQSTLQLSPGLQFKLAGKTTGAVSNYEANEKTVFSGGPVEPGQSKFGVLTFMPAAADNYELRFYPDVTSTNYLLVPDNSAQ